MNISRLFVLRPVATSLLMIALVLVGLVAVRFLPGSSLPDVDYPTIQIQTFYPGASPTVMATTVTAPLEVQLGEIPGLQQMDSYANSGGGYISLTFALGTDIKSTLVDVIGRLNRVPQLPQDAQKPFVQLASQQDANATLLWVFMQKLPGNSRDVDSYERFLKDTVVPRLEAIPGVGSANVNGASAAEELQIVFDPMRVAQLGIQIPKMAAKIGAADDASGGTIDVGRHRVPRVQSARRRLPAAYRRLPRVHVRVGSDSRRLLQA